MRKKNNKMLAKARLVAIIPRDLYYQTSGVFGIGMTLMLLAMVIPAALFIHHQRPSLSAPTQVSPLVIKAHILGKARKTVV